MRVFILLLVTSLFCSSQLISQQPDKLSAVEIYNKIEKLNFLGTVLYCAAHPDDENTSVISYMSNEVKARTAYLSLTRGDGGQNRIGAEIRENLGVIRTNELLRARATDGGEQFFTRAIDFGYSKHPDETLSIWERDKIMHDVVKVIREFKPDIIVNRFDHRTPGRTHGHHTTSAILSVDSYDKAADPDYQADLLGHLKPWQTKRIFFNTSWWFYGSRANFAEADKTNLLSVDVGVYYKNIGLSNSEIAALSRSMHKSQGFGSTGSRGSRNEYLELIKGELPADKANLFEGVNTTWSRVEGAGHIEGLIRDVLAGFNFLNPSDHIDDLLAIRAEIAQISDDHWKNYKLKEIDDIILQSLGLFIEAKANQANATAGDSIVIDLEVINRSEASVILKTIDLEEYHSNLSIELVNNESSQTEINYVISDADLKESNPYWLQEKGSLGLYAIDNKELIGQPANSAPISMDISLEINGAPMTISRDVIYKFTDPVKGEVYEPFVAVPEVSVQFEDPVYILSTREPKKVAITVKSFTDDVNGILSIKHPESFSVTPEQVDISMGPAGSIQIVEFEVVGPYLQESASFTAELKTNNSVLDEYVKVIEYDHIPKQYVRSASETTVQRLNIKTVSKKIAYVEGAGDEVAESLAQIGYQADIFSVEDITTDNLDDYDVVIIGIRAYNIHRDLKLRKDILMDFMSQGGTVIVQYNTNRGLRGDQISPYPLELSRDRITDESATVSFADPEHEVLNTPNKITSLDFKDWVQERGLYFPNEWDDRFEAPLAMADPNEEVTKGALLIAKHGKGNFIYSGISWFRELPAGVPGAYRLFANLIAIGSNDSLNSGQQQGDGK